MPSRWCHWKDVLCSGAAGLQPGGHVEYNYSHFNPKQKVAFDKVVNSAKNNEGMIFFLHSARGGGKTHVSNTIATVIHADGHIALCVTSSAIAALLLLMVILLTPASNFRFLLIILPPVISRGMRICMTFLSRLNSSYGMKLLCRSRSLVLYTQRFVQNWGSTYQSSPFVWRHHCYVHWWL